MTALNTAFKVDDWRLLPAGYWHWPNFSPAEMACRGSGELLVDVAAVTKLQQLRDHLGKPLIVTSAYRSEAHNRKVGGTRNSMHLRARAFDISMANHDPVAFEAAARACGFTGFGYYPDARTPFMHIDTGPERCWGKPFPPRPVVAAPPPEREDAEVVDDEIERDRFAPEPVKPAWWQTILKPEVLLQGLTGSLAAMVAAFGDALKTSLPLQVAVAVLIVGLGLCGAVFLATRIRRVRAGD